MKEPQHSRAWWCTPFFGRQRQGGWISEFKLTNLLYRVHSRTARTTQRNPDSKNQNQKKNQNNSNKQSPVCLWVCIPISDVCECMCTGSHISAKGGQKRELGAFSVIVGLFLWCRVYPWTWTRVFLARLEASKPQLLIWPPWSWVTVWTRILGAESRSGP